MANIVAPNSITFRDLRGHTGKVHWYIGYDPTVGAQVTGAHTIYATVATAIEAMTSALVVNATGVGGQILLPNSYGGAGPYANAETKARLTFLVSYTGGGQALTHYDIPAPLIAMFLSDKETINPANALVTAFVAAITTAVGGAAPTTRGNGVISTFVGGVLVRRKLQRKLTIWDKSPNLDEPEE